ncbi:pyridoxine/pyridoxamine 5'-phosphate oxidase 1, chloroplastic-like isoform X2 [Salvia miltiorrhiza]|uniref:pyridoxine/pyridoxamine 5'-phosphate oxidase 1, chloroplastic-like isoform X2 n=1 Tax=Salvia miltiorrhiza TaxID=226208 RepID=UPI0025ABA848|nr:pyridoxine/pyridoxamine 5'-phosphate oxidase 1, chloroplastic-like isoform X2 [Salvia miltiorrhiza]
MGDRQPITYLTQQQAAGIDELLLGPIGFTIDQLMELAGLSVASAIAEVYRRSKYKRVLVICGPGNNGGDGLVAARHLHHFGYNPCICYPKRTPKPLNEGLITQLESLPVPFLSLESLPEELLNFDILVDAIFGFSFLDPRPPFDDLIRRMASLRENCRGHHKSPVIVSVDVPSGWHAEDGDISGEGIKPDMLVSLMAPKLCAKRFRGPHHFLGGRFVPQSIVSKYELKLPAYPGTSMCVQIGEPTCIDEPGVSPPKCIKKSVEADPFVQFQKWFDVAKAAGLKDPDAMALSTATKDGKPSSRVVQLKKVDQGGFVWCSNYRSRKGSEISENPHASLLFYWSALNRQVQVEGVVQKVSNEESEQYFHSRSRDIQIAPALGIQSTVIPGREVVHQQYKELEEKYPEGTTIPRPQQWGGYRLVPERFEFWQGDESSVQLR